MFEPEYYPRCPTCGDPIDYCQGHPITDEDIEQLLTEPPNTLYTCGDCGEMSMTLPFGPNGSEICQVCYLERMAD